MIVKKIAKKVKSQSSFTKLAHYMMDERNGRQKVQEYWFTNCSFDESGDNILEIENTQLLNTRAKSDKTYHMVVSFQSDEYPSDEVLKEIEHELVKSIGLEHHQRMSVVHGNTNNLHIHIAINKVDPETLNCIDPFQDEPKLQIMAEFLEESLGLKRDNHTPGKDKNNERSPQEIHAGIESFKTWVKSEVIEEITATLSNDKSTWADLHKVLGQYDLELRQRGSGLVVASRSKKLFCKASDISRDLSKDKLIAKFGNFEKPKGTVEANKKFGEQSKIKSEYWEEYKKISNQNKREKTLKLAELKRNTAKEKLAILTSNKLERGKVKRNEFLDYDERKEDYKKVSKKRKEAFGDLYASSQKKRNEIYAETRHVSFKDFLMHKALAGDTKALEVLRNMKPENHTVTKEEANIIIGEDAKPIIVTKDKPLITKDGDVVYKIGRVTKIMDQGNRLKITELQKESEYIQALLFAREKFGKNLDIKGSDEFRKNIVGVAVKYNLDVEFSDDFMEDRRLTTIQSIDKARQVYAEHERAVQKRIDKALKSNQGKEKNDGTNRRGINVTIDKEGWSGYLESASRHFRGVESKRSNIADNIGSDSSARSETVRERISDVRARENGGIGNGIEAKTNTNTRTTSNGGREPVIRGDVKTSDKSTRDRERNGDARSRDGNGRGGRGA